MKKLLASQSTFFDRRVLIGILFLAGLLPGLFAFDAFPGASARAQGPRQNSKSSVQPKVSIRDLAMTQALKSRDDRVIAGHDSLVLLENSTSCFYCLHELNRECAPLVSV